MKKIEFENPLISGEVNEDGTALKTIHVCDEIKMDVDDIEGEAMRPEVKFMDVKEFDKLKLRDFENGAVRDEIRKSLKFMEWLMENRYNILDDLWDIIEELEYGACIMRYEEIASELRKIYFNSGGTKI